MLSRYGGRAGLALGLALTLTIAGCSADAPPGAEAPERDFWDVMVELTAAFESDPEAVVSVAEARIPAGMADDLDADDDGAVDRDEFWAFRERRAQRPYEGPADLGHMNVDREGGFPLNEDPEIVVADEAGLGDGDIVMGVVIAGEARAYPVNYMNGPLNEVVNDTLGEAHIAPSW